MQRKHFFFLFFISSILVAQTPFTKGVNLTNWFQSETAQQIQFTKYTKVDFENIKSLGCDVIRLPINLHSMTTGTEEHLLDPLFLFFLDQTMDWAEDLGMHLILDNHTFDPAANTDPKVGEILIPVWKQLAEHCKNRSNLIYYEVLNEPHGISDAAWNTIQQNAVNEIRKIDSAHTIVIGPAGWNSYNNLKFMPVYSDTNLLYTFHFYDPFIFTHQGASWTIPSMTTLGNVPFPYNSTSMPTIPASLKGSWIENAYNNYQNDGTVQKIKSLIDIAVNFKTQRNVNIFCGEFGVYKPKSKNEDRVLWYEEVRKYFEENNIPWTMWDYKHGFGLFEKGSNELFKYDLNIPLLEALDFNIPEQSEYKLLPDSVGSVIYSDNIGKNIFDASYLNNANLNFYSENAADGKFCVSWSSASQYGSIAFNFGPNKNLSKLINENYYLTLWVKGDDPTAKIDLRFVDTKTDVPEDHPWRIRFTLTNEKVALENKWHLLNIPLSEFVEQGAWENSISTWFSPKGEFDWAAIDVFEIVAEEQSLTNTNFWFDKIELTHPNLVGVKSNNLVSNNYKLHQNYPNPFNQTTTIKYTIPIVETSLATSQQEQLVQLKVYDLLGREVSTLINKKQKFGNHQVTFNASSLSSGMYFYTLKTKNFTSTKKMILVQ
ncbi:MAG: cellulase family glycosylhydrolase [Melioribacteraceae bacterium]